MVRGWLGSRGSRLPWQRVSARTPVFMATLDGHNAHAGHFPGNQRIDAGVVLAVGVGGGVGVGAGVFDSGGDSAFPRTSRGSSGSSGVLGSAFFNFFRQSLRCQNMVRSAWNIS